VRFELSLLGFFCRFLELEIGVLKKKFNYFKSHGFLCKKLVSKLSEKLRQIFSVKKKSKKNHKNSFI
jgi:hypothetical protein